MESRKGCAQMLRRILIAVVLATQFIFCGVVILTLQGSLNYNLSSSNCSRQERFPTGEPHATHSWNGADDDSGWENSAVRQLNFVQNQSWISEVYRSEEGPMLRAAQDVLNVTSISEFCAYVNASGNATLPEYAIFTNVMLVGRTLLLPASIECESSFTQSLLNLSTLHHGGQLSTPQLEVLVVKDTDSFYDFEPHYSCHERVYEPSILFSFINWPQHGHALFNGISLLWEAFKAPQTGPLFHAGKNVRMYAYGDSIEKTRRLEGQDFLPFFDMETVKPVMGMFSQQPIRSLANLLMQAQRHPVCFSYLIVGIRGQLDHYNFEVPHLKWREFSEAIKDYFRAPKTPRLNFGRPLERVAPKEGVDNNNVDSMPSIRAMDYSILPDRPRLTIVNRKENRQILNVAELLSVARETTYFKSVNVVYFESMRMDEQVRLMASTDVLFGMDGTGLMNGIFMPEGGIVVHVRPYGCAKYLADKGTNFDRLWSANPGRVIRYESGDRRSTVSHPSSKERPEVVFGSNSTRGYRFPFILRQNTVVDRKAFRCILDAAHNLLRAHPVHWPRYRLCTNTVFR